MERQARQLIRLVMIIALLVIVVITFTTVWATSRQIPPGSYVTTITETDIPSEFPPEVIPMFVGQWVTEFTEAGDYFVSKEGEVWVVGRYTSNLARLVMTDLEGPASCPAVKGLATGVYDWTFDSDELALAAVRDGCGARQFVLTVHPLQKQ